MHAERGDLTNSREGKELRYRPLDEVIDWHKNHQLLVLNAHDSWQGSA